MRVNLTLSNTVTVGSNPTEGMGVCSQLCMLHCRGLAIADPGPRTYTKCRESLQKSSAERPRLRVSCGGYVGIEVVSYMSSCKQNNWLIWLAWILVDFSTLQDVSVLVGTAGMEIEISAIKSEGLWRWSCYYCDKLLGHYSSSGGRGLPISIGPNILGWSRGRWHSSLRNVVFVLKLGR